MGLAYRSGLNTFKLEGFDHKAGDSAVSGIDRVPTQLIIDASITVLVTVNPNQ